MKAAPEGRAEVVPISDRETSESHLNKDLKEMRKTTASKRFKVE